MEGQAPPCPRSTGSGLRGQRGSCPSIFRFAAVYLLSTTALAEPLPIDPLWQSETFRKSVTGSYGIDSRIEPRFTTDEEEYLRAVAEAMQAGDREKAIAELEGTSLLEESPVLLFQLGGLKFEIGDFEEAARRFEAAIEIFPNFRDAHRNLALVRMRKEEFDQAEIHLLRAVELGATDGLSYGLLGYLRARKDEHQPALDAYRMASLIQPGEIEWKLGQAQALAALGEADAALSLYETILKKRPADFPLWLLRADTFSARSEDEKAIASLELVRRAGALSPASTLALGHLLLRVELPDLALERYREALAMEPRLPLDSAVDAVDYLVRRGDYSQAGELAVVVRGTGYELADSATTADVETRSATGTLVRAEALVAMQTGDAEAAATALRAWIDREPTDGQALILLAGHLADQDEREQAEMLYEQAARIPGSAAEAMRAHGTMLVEEREYAKALVLLEKSQQLAPTESLAEYVEAVRELAE